MLKLEPKGLEIERIKFKLPPKESPNKFYNVKAKTKGFFYIWGVVCIYIILCIIHNIGGYWGVVCIYIICL